MRQHDCILVRTGEQALKSKQVQRKWWRILLNNMRAGLQAEGVKFKFETNPNRIFVYTEDLEKAGGALKRVFGITSFSRAWTCFSGLDEIRLLAADIATEVLKLDNTKSFAIRAYRAGRHKFTSQVIAEEAGAAVKRVTDAKVDLSNPDNEIEIEARSRKTYIFVERVKGPGGLPVGTAGKVLALVNDKGSAVAAWLIARRGAQLVLLTDKKGQKYAEALKKWHYGKKMEIRKREKLSKTAKELGLKAVVTGEKFSKALEKEIEDAKLLHLRPLVAMGRKEIGKMAAKLSV